MAQSQSELKNSVDSQSRTPRPTIGRVQALRLKLHHLVAPPTEYDYAYEDYLRLNAIVMADAEAKLQYVLSCVEDGRPFSLSETEKSRSQRDALDAAIRRVLASCPKFTCPTITTTLKGMFRRLLLRLASPPDKSDRLTSAGVQPDSEAILQLALDVVARVQAANNTESPPEVTTSNETLSNSATSDPNHAFFGASIGEGVIIRNNPRFPSTGFRGAKINGNVTIDNGVSFDKNGDLIDPETCELLGPSTYR